MDESTYNKVLDEQNPKFDSCNFFLPYKASNYNEFN